MPSLRDLLGLTTSLSPFWNNVIVSQCQVLFYKIGSEWLWARYSSLSSLRIMNPSEHHHHPATMMSRSPQSLPSAFHLLLTFTSLLFWPLFVVVDADWSWRLNVLVPSVLMARLFYKGAIVKDPDDLEVRTLSRTSSPSDLLWGPLQWAAVLVYLGLYEFQTTQAAIPMAAVGFGDALAPFFGAHFGRHRYQMPLQSAGTPKTMEGSLVGVFLGTSVGIYLALGLWGLPRLPLRVVLVYSALAAVVEGTSPSRFDNLTVPLTIHLSMARIQQWFALTSSSTTMSSSDVHHDANDETAAALLQQQPL